MEKDVSRDERQFLADEIRLIGKRFIKGKRHSLMLARLRRLLPGTWFRVDEHILSTIDQVVFVMPGVSHLAGMIAILARTRDANN